MQASHAIAALDRQLAAKGTDITFRREDFNTGRQDVPCRAFVRGFKPEELVGGVDQNTSHVVISPTDLKASGIVPTKGDYALIDGRSRYVDVAETIRIDNVPVRYNLTVTG